MNSNHIILTSHSHEIYKESPAIDWGQKTAQKRGPIVGTLTDLKYKNTIGTHSGSYSIYRALAKACGELKRDHRPDFKNTNPTTRLGPFPSWCNPEKIVSLDPWGAQIVDMFAKDIKKGLDIRPSIAITNAHIQLEEIRKSIQEKILVPDGKILLESGDVVVTKAAVEPVWYLPGMAKRFQIDEGELRKILFQDTGGMFPELITRPDLKVFLPPIGSSTVYIFGPLPDDKRKLTVRVHDECNGSDVFGSDICTCRPYLLHGIEEGIKTAQQGGTGVVIYFRKEGRALGEVTKFLVYNARKRQEGGDTAENYFKRTECIAGAEDMRFQELMPDVLHWLGITRIDQLVSMSDQKYNAIINSGIDVIKRISIPSDRIPQDAWVEIEAKKARGYYTEDEIQDLKKVKGRKL